MRVALLPAMDDGFSIAFWLRNFRTWADEVDRLIVLTSGPSAETIPIEGERIDVLRYPGDWVQHGAALNILVGHTAPGDLLMLCEEDGYIRRPGVVREHFDRLEAGLDVLASPRDGGSMDLLDAAHKRWGECRAGDEQGTGFWPAFCFIRRDILTATDSLYEPRRWRKGQVVPGLRRRAREDGASDETMMSVSWQIRDSGARIELTEQYRVSVGFLMQKWLPRDPPWMHIGSLSAGAGLYNGVSRFDPAHVASIPYDWTRRISWWRRFALDAPEDHPRRARYLALLDELVRDSGLDPYLVEKWSETYDRWITWS